MKDHVISAFSDEYDADLRVQCEALTRFGISYTEVRGINGKNISLLDAAEVREAKRVLDGYGIRASAIGSPIGKIRLDGDLAAHREMAKRVFESACLLETDRVRMFSFYLPDGRSREDCRGAVLDELSYLVSLAEQYGLLLCHENEALIYGESPADCRSLLDAFGGRLGCVFDMGNFVLDGYDPMTAYETLREHIVYFHIKDALFAGAIVPAGKGEARIKEILALHGGVTDTALITLEPHLQTFSGLNALVGKSFENPYRYETPQAAFADAVAHLRALL